MNSVRIEIRLFVRAVRPCRTPKEVLTLSFHFQKSYRSLIRAAGPPAGQATEDQIGSCSRSLQQAFEKSKEFRYKTNSQETDLSKGVITGLNLALTRRSQYCTH
jgi:hypothetical protein